MTDDESKACQAIGQCTFVPGTWDKRFAKCMYGWPLESPLSDAQRNLLWVKVWRYRRQIRDKMLVAKAKKINDEYEGNRHDELEHSKNLYNA